MTTSSSWTLSTVLPLMTECTPQESLPIMPPSVQRLWVTGSGPKVRSRRSAAARSVSRTTPGCTRAVLPVVVEHQDLVHVAREVEDHGLVAGLPGEAGAAPPGQDHGAVAPARGQGGLDVVGVPRQDDAHRHLAVVRGVGGIEGPRSRDRSRRRRAAPRAVRARGRRLPCRQPYVPPSITRRESESLIG